MRILTFADPNLNILMGILKFRDPILNILMRTLRFANPNLNVLMGVFKFTNPNLSNIMKNINLFKGPPAVSFSLHLLQSCQIFNRFCKIS